MTRRINHKKKLIHYPFEGLVAGCDEAGRGCLAGPVVAASVILPKKCRIPGLNDSKKLSEKQREALFPIVQKKAIAYAVGVYSNVEIDEVNILNASFLSMHRAIHQLEERPELILVDGNRFIPYEDLKHECIIKGDGKYLSIAAASIIAKVTRDRIMQNFDVEYPAYGWKKNKGYPTIAHREAILKYGPTILHRKSFKLLSDEQLSLNL